METENSHVRLMREVAEDNAAEARREEERRQRAIDSWFTLPRHNSAYEYFAKGNWLVEGLLPLSYLTVLGGAPKTGKSCLATAIAYAVATGKEFAGRKTRQSPVLWCAFEESEIERAPILARVPRDESGEAAEIWTCYKRPYIDGQEGLDVLSYWLGKTGARLLVIDSLHGATTGHTLADNGTARRAMMGLKDLADGFSCTVLALHHLTKSQSRGTQADRFGDSTQILATASMHIHMEVATLYQDGTTGQHPFASDEDCSDESPPDASRPRPDARPSARRITLTSAGRGDFACGYTELDSTDALTYAAPSTAKRTQTLKEKIVAALNDQDDTAQGLAKRLDLDVRYIRNHLGQLQKAGTVGVVTKSANERTYTAIPPDR